MMQSTIGSSRPLNCVMSPKCFIYSLPFLSFSRTKSAEQNHNVSCWARCSLLIMCNSALDFFCFLFVLLHSTDAFAIRIMPHAIRPERAALRWAEAYFCKLTAHTIGTLGSNRFQRRKYFCHNSSSIIRGKQVAVAVCNLSRRSPVTQRICNGNLNSGIIAHTVVTLRPVD